MTACLGPVAAYRIPACGFGYVYAARQQWPAPGQLAGLIPVMAGVTLTIAVGWPGRSPS